MKGILFAKKSLFKNALLIQNQSKGFPGPNLNS